MRNNWLTTPFSTAPAPGLESLRRSQRPVSMVVHQKHNKWDSDPDFIGQFFFVLLIFLEVES